MVARADMESANPVPIVASGCGGAGRVIGIVGLRCDRVGHDGRNSLDANAGWVIQ